MAIPTNFMTMSFSEKISWHTSNAGWSAAELARRASLQPATVRNWLSGKNTPDVYAAYRIAKALGVPLEYLVDDSVPVGHVPTRESVLARLAEELRAMEMSPAQWIGGTGQIKQSSILEKAVSDDECSENLDPPGRVTRKR